MKKIAIAIAIALWVLITGAMLTPTAIANSIWADEPYRELGQAYIVEQDEDTVKLEDYTQFETVLKDNSTGTIEDHTAIAVYFEVPTIDNFSGLFRMEKNSIYDLTLKQKIYDDFGTSLEGLNGRSKLFNDIKTYVNPINKATRTIDFIAISPNTGKTINFNQIKSTGDDGIDSDLSFLMDTTAFQNKFTSSLIGIGFGFGVAYLFILSATSPFIIFVVLTIIESIEDKRYEEKMRKLREEQAVQKKLREESYVQYDEYGVAHYTQKRR